MIETTKTESILHQNRQTIDQGAMKLTANDDSPSHPPQHEHDCEDAAQENAEPHRGFLQH